MSESDTSVLSPNAAWGKSLCSYKISGNKEVQKAEGKGLVFDFCTLTPVEVLIWTVKRSTNLKKNTGIVTSGRRWEDSAADQHRQTQLPKHSAAKSQLGVHICVKYIREIHGCRHKSLQRRAEKASQFIHSLYPS